MFVAGRSRGFIEPLAGLPIHLLRHQAEVGEHVLVAADPPVLVVGAVGVKVARVLADSAGLDAAGQVVGLEAELLAAAHSRVQLPAEGAPELRAARPLLDNVVWHEAEDTLVVFPSLNNKQASFMYLPIKQIR